MREIQYDISALDSVPQTKANTYCKPSPFEGDRNP